MKKKMKGTVAQFGTKGYGFITGDDDEKYFVHQKNIYNKSRLRADTRVVFSAENSDKGLVAVDVKLEKQKSEPTPLTDTSIKAMFLVLFIMQAVVAYQVFFIDSV
jgi:CspA family cold shock protein